LVASRRPSRHSRQRGVALLIALIMLVAMMMTGIAMFRKLGGAAILAGNLTFTSAAINSAEEGSEAARARLMGSSTATLANGAAGYFPASCYTNTSQTLDCTTAGAPGPFDPTAFAWDDTVSTLVTADDGAGNQVRYVIHRLCSVAGSLSASGQMCSYSSTVTTVMHTDVPEITASIAPLYRITTRVTGPRNTIAYTQVTLF
jgi:type IV pilus assembly protein PilX